VFFTTTPQQPAGNNPIIIDPLNFRVTIINAYSRGQAPNPSKSNSATGFFYKHNNEKYLVTNRHVVVSEAEESYPDILKIMVHTSHTSLIPRRVIDIPLYNGISKVWIEHQDNIGIPDPKQKIDLAIINVNDKLENNDVVDFFTANDLPNNDFYLSLGDLTIIIGYPLAFHDTVHYLPITRSGTVASTWRAYFSGKKHFLVDAKLHPGTSGSPVVIPSCTTRRDVRGGVGIGVFPAMLVGVNSGMYGNLDLNVIWYSSLIPEILNQQQPTGQITSTPTQQPVTNTPPVSPQNPQLTQP
jgi:hypothetical protein